MTDNTDNHELYDQAQQVGYLGNRTDPTDDAAYTFAGALAKAATPENDTAASEAANEAVNGRGIRREP